VPGEFLGVGYGSYDAVGFFLIGLLHIKECLGGQRRSRLGL
jgi:hypothetical protein